MKHLIAFVAMFAIAAESDAAGQVARRGGTINNIAISGGGGVAAAGARGASAAGLGAGAFAGRGVNGVALAGRSAFAGRGWNNGYYGNFGVGRGFGGYYGGSFGGYGYSGAGLNYGYSSYGYGAGLGYGYSFGYPAAAMYTPPATYSLGMFAAPVGPQNVTVNETEVKPDGSVVYRTFQMLK